MSFFPEPKVIRISGLGNKAIISILEDYFYFAPSKGLGYWDVCAAHALTKEAGGGCYYVNKEGEEVTYPETYEEKYFEKCFCMSSDKSKVIQFLEVINKEKIII